VNGRLFGFAGGEAGAWRVTEVRAVAGETLPGAASVDVLSGAEAMRPRAAAWVLRGVTSHERYVTRAEHGELVAKQPALGRPEATRAALIPIRKSAAWWSLSQDERRAILEERSRHIATGIRYLPAVARRLHHCRDLATDEPFDFLTWFEFAPADEPAFDRLVAELRTSEEWRYVEREVDIRLSRREQPGSEKLQSTS
jgi:chlorite dismutase